MNDDLSAQKDPQPWKPMRLQIGSCEYACCGLPAYYTIDFDCDDITADLCDKHHTAVMKKLHATTIPGLLNCESDE